MRKYWAGACRLFHEWTAAVHLREPATASGPQRRLGSGLRAPGSGLRGQLTAVALVVVQLDVATPVDSDLRLELYDDGFPARRHARVLAAVAAGDSDPDGTEAAALRTVTQPTHTLLRSGYTCGEITGSLAATETATGE
ncbi:hypothetical protein CTZ27_36220 [Streptomyces griseocarneus]|nr:hypothetical protein CTZ27_36220 [Streptomyces griseocarneus]